MLQKVQPLKVEFKVSSYKRLFTTIFFSKPFSLKWWNLEITFEEGNELNGRFSKEYAKESVKMKVSLSKMEQLGNLNDDETIESGGGLGLSF